MTSVLGYFACGYDAVLYVDETAAGDLDDDAPQFVVGRLFGERSQPWLKKLDRVLLDGCSEEWHAGDRAKGDLFIAREHEAIVSLLSDLPGSLLVTMAAFPSALDEHRSEYFDLVAHHVQLQDDWPTRPRDIRALAVFRYFAMALHAIGQNMLGKGSRMLVICDQMRQWLRAKPAEGWARRIEPYAAIPLAGHTTVDLFTVQNKDDPNAVYPLRWLGLVDSEAWAMTRFLRAKFGDGRAGNKHYQEWADGGRPDEPVMTQEDFDRICGQKPGLEAYVQRVLEPAVRDGRWVFVP